MVYSVEQESTRKIAKLVTQDIVPHIDAGSPVFCDDEPLK
jgi:hypothetical protein